MVLVLGEIIVDVTLGSASTKLRLGGVFHACRALWAAGIDYQLAYISPEYIDGQVEQMSKNMGAKKLTKIGTITGSPNVILVQNAQETSHQGYELILRDEHDCSFNGDNLAEVSKTVADDILIFPGQYDLAEVISILKDSRARIHVDWANTKATLSSLNVLARPIETIFTSTSSELFLEQSEKDFSKLRDEVFSSNVSSLVFKENRGGACFYSKSGEQIEVGAQIREVEHSVGVGDCFDAIFVGLAPSCGTDAALSYATWIAAEYAVTSYSDDFASAVRGCLAIPPEEISKIPGVRLAWGDRKAIHIYIAAPDFDYVDTRTIDEVANSLEYHNFSPHRPVKENGQVSDEMTIPEKRSLCFRDIELLKSCHAVIAILEHDDPGTFVEIGLAAALEIPVLIFDPLERARNPMLLGTAYAVCNSMDSLLLSLFAYFGSKASAK